MANNRLYIRDRESGRRFYLARTMGTRWLLACSAEELQSWLDGFDRVGDTRHRGAPADLLALDDDAEHTTQLELFDDKESDQPRNAAMMRLRRSLFDIFETAHDDASINDVAGIVELESLRAEDARDRVVRDSQQETVPLSTEPTNSAELPRECTTPPAASDAPRSGALEPEETSGGPQRRGS